MKNTLHKLLTIATSLLIVFAANFLPCTAQAQIFFSADGDIQTIEPGDITPEVVVEGDAYGISVDLDGEFIYWTEPSAAGTSIKRADLDGSNVTVLLDEDFSARGLTLDLTNEKMYWANLMNEGQLLRANLDGTELEVLVAGDEDGVTDGILDVALDLENEHIYWVRTGAIMRSGMDGENVEEAVEITSFVQPSAIELNTRDGYIYWVDTSEESIMRAGMDNGVAEILINADEPYGLSVDVENDRIFWISDFFFAGDSQVSTANLDGTDPQIIIDTGATRGAIFASGWELATSAESRSEYPERISLSQNYPNPFNPATVIEFNLKETAEVSLTVFNNLGQQVAILVENRVHHAGNHRIQFDASSLPSGIYLYQIRVDDFTISRKMTLLK